MSQDPWETRCQALEKRLTLCQKTHQRTYATLEERLNQEIKLLQDQNLILLHQKNHLVHEFKMDENSRVIQTNREIQLLRDEIKTLRRQLNQASMPHTRTLKELKRKEVLITQLREDVDQHKAQIHSLLDVLFQVMNEKYIESPLESIPAQETGAPKMKQGK